MNNGWAKSQKAAPDALFPYYSLKRERLQAILDIAREPLVHFLAAAAALFVLYGALNGDDAALSEKDIVVTRSDILTYMQFRAKAFDGARFEEIYGAMNESERDTLIADYIREEAMYREAKALNLDKNDYVAKRRLIQQLEFITQGFVEAGTSLTDEAIAAYYAEHKAEYAEPAKITFTHVFFSSDRHGPEEARRLAEAELSKLNADKTPFHEAPGRGDRPLFHVNYVMKEKDLVASHFGEDFADAAFALQPDPGLWRGPYQSPYGFHLILVTQFAQIRQPPLAEIRGRVAADAQRQIEQERLDAATDGIVDTYRVRRADDLTLKDASDTALQ